MSCSQGPPALTLLSAPGVFKSHERRSKLLAGVLFLDRLHRLPTELVATFVVIMPGMPLDPVPAHLVLQGRGIQGAPEILILDWLFAGRLPAVLLPAGQPFRDAVADVLGVRVHLHGAGLFEVAERLDGRAQFHAIVRRGWLASTDLLAPSARLQNRRPSTHAGVAEAAAVGVNDDLREGGIHRDV